jgi:carotenoid cleavage dioxygenase
MMFFGYGPMPPYLRYSVANAQGAIVHTTTIDLPRPVMIHDFAITARRTVFLDLPETMSLERLLLGQPLMRFQPELGARIGILSRRSLGRDIRWFPIDPCYVFHTLAAWDDGDEVVLIACRMADFPADIEGGTAAQRRRGDSTPRWHRWRCHLPTGRVREERLDDTAVEFPRFNETLLGRPIRYGYAGKARAMKFEGFVKFDLATGRSLEHAHGPGRFGGEGVFVPRPGAREEDAGWLLTFVYDEHDNRSELVVVDAQDFRARPVARVLLPQRVPYGFHGLWLDQAQL